MLNKSNHFEYDLKELYDVVLNLPQDDVFAFALDEDNHPGEGLSCWFGATRMQTKMDNDIVLVGFYGGACVALNVGEYIDEDDHEENLQILSSFLESYCWSPGCPLYVSRDEDGNIKTYETLMDSMTLNLRKFLGGEKPYDIHKFYELYMEVVTKGSDIGLEGFEDLMLEFDCCTSTIEEDFNPESDMSQEDVEMWMEKLYNLARC